jgi:photosystem II stability/assembly factor-like uncharacterized protein
MTFQRFSALLLTALLGASAASAAAPTWTSLGPFGGGVAFITPDPIHRGVLYAATSLGIYRTADAGGSWTPIYTSPLLGGEGRVAVDPFHPKTIYLNGAAGGQRLLKSTDSGAHWSSISAGLPLSNFILAVDPAKEGRLYAGSLSQGMWRSLDAGASWQPASTGLPAFPSIRAVAPAPGPAGKILIAVNTEIYRSDDAGASWTLVHGGLPTDTSTAMAFAPADPRTAYVYFNSRGLYRSTDGGVSWRRVLGARSREAQEISISPRATRVVYVKFGDGILFRSTDGGQHWSQLSSLPTSTVAADPFSATTVYSSLYTGQSLGGVWRSVDQGATWTARNQGMTSIQAASLAIQNGDPSKLWITPGNGTALRTINGGSAWIQSPVPAGETLLQLYSGPGSRIFAYTWDELFTPHIGSTDDNGGTWTQLPVPTLHAQKLAFLSVPTAPSTLYAAKLDDPVYGGGLLDVLRSTDGGAHWESSQEFTLTCGLGEMAAAPSNPAVLYLGGCKNEHEAGVLRSGDGGVTFADVSAGLPASHVQALTVAPGAPDLVWAGTAGDGVWKSTNGGASWAPAGDELEGLEVTALLAPGVSGRVYAALRDGRIFRSVDGGASWQDWTGALPRSRVFDLIARPGAPRRIYAATHQGVWTLTEAD